MLDAEKDGEKSDDAWLDLSDEDTCNWMMFVRPAQNHLEQNLVAYQYGSEIFYTTIKNIQPKQELKVSHCVNTLVICPVLYVGLLFFFFFTITTVPTSAGSCFYGKGCEKFFSCILPAQHQADRQS